MHIENTYCRPPIARFFNSIPGCGWSPATNEGNGKYISGFPDGIACVFGVEVAVECKGPKSRDNMAACFMGDPTVPDITIGWHYHQRQWWHDFAQSRMTYWIALWLYSERNPARVYQHKAGMWLAPPEIWLTAENLLAGRKTLCYDASVEAEIAFKDRTARSLFQGFELEFRPPGSWAIPCEHPFWSAVRKQATGALEHLDHLVAC
jgi:hypothetical protein